MNPRESRPPARCRLGAHGGMPAASDRPSLPVGTSTLGAIPRLAFTIVTALATAIAAAPAAHAIPAFARAHALTCGACHGAMPQLNTYGEAFRERGYVLPGHVRPRASTASPARAAAERLAIWFRGPLFERSDFRRGPDRTEAEVPSAASVYVATPLVGPTAFFLEASSRLRQLESRSRGRFVETTEIGIERAFVSADVARILARAPVATNPIGPFLTLGRFDPSTLLSYPTRRSPLHDVPGDTERSDRHSDVHRFPLTPYAFGARYFGLFDRSGTVLLPTTESLVNTRGNYGVGVHGRIAAARLLYGLGVLNGAAPEVSDTGDTMDPYGFIRYDFGVGETTGSVSAFASYGPGTAQVRFTAREAADGIAGRRTVDWVRAGLAASVDHRAFALRGAVVLDDINRVPAAIAAAFDDSSQGLSVEADYRLRPAWLATMRYDWMNPGGFRSALAGLDGPRSAQALHLQLRWFFLEGQTRPRSTAAMVALSLRDSINLTPGGGTHPFRAWANTLLFGVDIAH